MTATGFLRSEMGQGIGYILTSERKIRKLTSVSLLLTLAMACGSNSDTNDQEVGVRITSYPSVTEESVDISRSTSVSRIDVNENVDTAITPETRTSEQLSLKHTKSPTDTQTVSSTLTAAVSPTHSITETAPTLTSTATAAVQSLDSDTG